MLANDAAMDADREAARRKEAAREEAARAKKEARTRDAEAAETALAFAAAAAKAAKAAARAARAAAATGDEAVEEADADDRREGNVAAVVVSDEVDPLDAFMAENNAKAEAMLRSSRDKKTDASETVASGGAKTTLAGGVLLKTSAGGGGAFFGGGRLAASRQKPSSLRPSGGAARGATSARRAAYASSDDESSGEDDSSDASSSGRGSDSDDEAWAKKQSGRMSKAEKLGVTDHSAVAYAPFRKNFYIESYEIARMTKEETKALRAELEGITCRGVAVPKPIRTWAQCGLSNRVMELIRRSGFERPTPIQCQALPAIMSGRDCVGVAKTGSGKTLAYVLPMLRHVKDQPAIEQGDGPIGMIMGPTRELVTQIGKDCKKFGRAAGLVAASVYGGSGVAAQIGELKRGCEIVACTPGRMIDVLTTGAGRITNLRRVTYMVLDEADRMFDMGFEPQITRIMNNLRPDRQTVMFSATFPRAMEALARSALSDPVEIQVGGKSVVNSDIEQLVEMREEEDRFLRALELLGEWYERGKIIIFVAKQDKCDRVFRDLLRSGYPCLSLHGGKEQTDRECTIADFKSDVCNVLVATSVAARGLDVKDLRLVINYDTPNHLEDYVHRVGRTGRAGNKGTAVTFISSEEAKFAPDLVKAMTDAKQPVPADLRRMADEVVAARKKAGKKGAPSAGGFGGSGFAFSREERDAERRAKRNAARAAGLEVEEEDHLREKEEDSDDEKFDDDGEPVYESIGRPGAASSAAAAAEAARAQAEAAEKEAEAALRAAQAGGDAARRTRPPRRGWRRCAPPRSPPRRARERRGGASGGISSGQSMPPPPARPRGRMPSRSRRARERRGSSSRRSGQRRPAPRAPRRCRGAQREARRGGRRREEPGARERAALRVRAGDQRFPAARAVEGDAQGLARANPGGHRRCHHDQGAVLPSREDRAAGGAEALPPHRGAHGEGRQGGEIENQGDHRDRHRQGKLTGRVPGQVQSLEYYSDEAPYHPANATRRRRLIIQSKVVSRIHTTSTIAPPRRLRSRYAYLRHGLSGRASPRLAHPRGILAGSFPFVLSVDFFSPFRLRFFHASFGFPTMTLFCGVICLGIANASTSYPLLRRFAARAASITIGAVTPGTYRLILAARAFALPRPRWQHGTTATGAPESLASASTKSVNAPHACTDANKTSPSQSAFSTDASTKRTRPWTCGQTAVTHA